MDGIQNRSTMFKMNTDEEEIESNKMDMNEESPTLFHSFTHK